MSATAATPIQKPNPAARPVRIAHTSATVLVAPGERYVDLPPEHTPRVGIVRMVPVGEGLYKPRLQVIENWIRVTEAEQFGIFIRRDTLVRLGVAGFIPISQPSPQITAISLEGVLDHIEACKDPEFWTEKRMHIYRTANDCFRTN